MSTIISRHIQNTRKKSTLEFTSEPGCDICPFLHGAGDDEVVLETRYWRAVLAPDQYYLGRMYLTSRRHFGNMGEMSFEEAAELRHVFWRLEYMAKGGLGAEHVTYAFLMNNAYSEEIPRPHVHAHVRPRYSEPVTVAGITFTDPTFGAHHLRGKETTKIVSRRTLTVIGDMMRSAPVPKFGLR